MSALLDDGLRTDPAPVGGFAPSKDELLEYSFEPAEQFVRHGRIAVHWARVLRRYPCALAVAVMLSSYAKTEHGDRKCWVSQKTLAQELGVTERAIRSAFAVLRKCCFITKEERRFQKSSRLYLDDYEPKVNR